jgi:hypothetical protein
VWVCVGVCVIVCMCVCRCARVWGGGLCVWVAVYGCVCDSVCACVVVSERELCGCVWGLCVRGCVWEYVWVVCG